jgi:hypothetical protein
MIASLPILTVAPAYLLTLPALSGVANRARALHACFISVHPEHLRLGHPLRCYFLAKRRWRSCSMVDSMPRIWVPAPRAALELLLLK